MHEQLHPMTPHHLPFYIAKPGETDVLMIATGIFLIVAVLGVGNFYLICTHCRSGWLSLSETQSD